MNKRILSMLLVLAIVLSVVPMAFAAEVIATGTCGEKLTWVLTDDGTMNISGTGHINPVYADWDSYKESVQSLIIENGVTCFSNAAFGDFTNLTNVTIPDSVTEIGPWAFAGCTSLTSITIPNSVTTIDDSAFIGCEGLADKDGFVIVDDTLFDYYGSGGDVVIPDSVTTISERTFSGCTALSGITLSENITEIGFCAFNECTNLSTIVFPASLERIWEGAFCGCDSLEKVYFKGDFYKYIQLNDAYPADLFSSKKHITFYYPADNETWNSIANGNYRLPIQDDVSYVTYDPSILFPSEPKPTTPAIAFMDMHEGQWFYDTVLWAVDKGITTGTSETTFSPEDECTRNQVVTFLWRAAGEPEPTSTENPFVDVKEEDYFYKAVLWAVENGITNGVDTTHFDSEGICTRAQVVTFLWRAAEKPPAGDNTNPFADVKKGGNSTWYYDAVLWAAEEGITSGTTQTTFEPESTCTRAQIVTFLYRYLA